MPEEPRRSESGSAEPGAEVTLASLLQGERSRRARFLAGVRRYLISGVLVSAPIGFTLYLSWLILRFIDRRVVPLIPPAINPETLLPPALRPFGIPGLGLLVALLGLVLVGFLANRAIGRWTLRLGERLLEGVPIVRGMHGALKQITESVLSQHADAFREVVLFEYPRPGIWALGFVTGTTRGQVQSITTEETVNVFLPTTPNPTSGYLLFVPRRDVVVLDMTIEEGMKMIISAGMVSPPGPNAPAAVAAAERSVPEAERPRP